MSNVIFHIVVFIIAIFLTSCEHKADSSEFFIIPEGHQAKLCKFNDGRITTIHSPPVPEYPNLDMTNFRMNSRLDTLRFHARFFEGLTYDPDNGWITCIKELGAAISIMKYDPVDTLVAYPDLRLPNGYKAMTTAISGNVLYVGGECGNDILGYYDLSATNPKWVRMEIPDTLGRDSKRIDGLLVSGRRLIAVDDIVFPKWLLLYNISNPRRPRLRDVRLIPGHGVYEGIKKAALGDNWVAILSRTSGQMGFSDHIAIFDRDDLVERGVISNHVRSSRWAAYRDVDQDTLLIWQSISFLNDILVISCGGKGLGIINLSELHGVHEISDQLTELIRYRTFSHATDAYYLNLMPIEHLNKMAVIIHHSGKFETLLLDESQLVDRSGSEYGRVADTRDQ